MISLNIFRYRHAISLTIHAVITEQLVIIQRNDKENVYFLCVHLVFMYFPFPTLFLDVCMCSCVIVHAKVCVDHSALLDLILFYFFKVFSKDSPFKRFAFLKANVSTFCELCMFYVSSRLFNNMHNIFLLLLEAMRF